MMRLLDLLGWLSYGFLAAVITVIFWAFFMSGCAPANSDGTRAVEIPGPVGVVCYGILNNAGEVTGGNCLPLK